MDIHVLAEKILSYKGGPVTREMVMDVLDFNILLEPVQSPTSWTSRSNPLVDDALFDEWQKQWAGTIERGHQIIRQYGMQLPPDFTRMQVEFYSFTNSEKYRKSIVTISVARETLNKSWKGINGWCD